MTAFLSFLNTFAIWIYLLGVVGILLGIKMLFDARRAGRTTLFTLEQEQASDRAFRAVLVMGAFTLLIAGVAGINAFVGPNIPAEQPTDIIKPTVVAYTPPVILPTDTRQPTQTPLPATQTPTAKPAQVTPTTAPAQQTASAKPTTPAEQPTVAPPPSPTSALIYPRPPLNTPPNGDSIGSNNIRFSWGMNSDTGGYDVPQNLPPDQFYRVIVSYTSRSQNKPVAIVVCTHDTSVDRRTGLDLTDYRSDALEGDFKWNVTVVRSASQKACESGDVSPLSPPSLTFQFKLP